MKAPGDREPHDTRSAWPGDQGANPALRRRARSSRGALCLWLLFLVLSTAGAAIDATGFKDSPASAGDAKRAVVAGDQHACLRCHAMTNLAYRNPADGRIIDLSVDGGAFRHSIHGGLACVDCHLDSYRRYPHPELPAPGDLDCIGCHREDDKDLVRNWLDLAAQFKRSVHAVSKAPEAAGFSCHSCHDPHRFRPATVGEPIAAIVRSHNQVCLSCHQGLIVPASLSHGWLPNRNAHWDAVRCVDCHTPVAPPANHEILAAAQSAKQCVECHSTDSQLLVRLYHYQSQEDIARRGLIAKAVYNEAYVIGMSKSPALDRISLMLMGLLVLLLAAHGVGRYLARRTQGRSQ
jgi:hypothetical protein